MIEDAAGEKGYETNPANIMAIFPKCQERDIQTALEMLAKIFCQKVSMW